METRHESEIPNISEGKMRIEVKLLDQDSDSTRTRFYINGEFKGYGVEDEQRDVKVKGETRIPNGWYELGSRLSPKFSSAYYMDDNYNIIRSSKRTTDTIKKRYHTQHELIWVLDVPNFDFILWHWGNTDDNTDGCYLVGSGVGDFNGQRCVTASRDKYEEVYPIIMRAIKCKGAIVHYDR